MKLIRGAWWIARLPYTSKGCGFLWGFLQILGFLPQSKDTLFGISKLSVVFECMGDYALW